MDDKDRCTAVLSNGFRCALVIEHRGIHKIDRSEKPIFDHAPVMEPSQISSSLLDIVNAHSKEIANLRAVVADFQTRISESEQGIEDAFAKIEVWKTHEMSRRDLLPAPSTTPPPAPTAAQIETPASAEKGVQQ